MHSIVAVNAIRKASSLETGNIFVPYYSTYLTGLNTCIPSTSRVMDNPEYHHTPDPNRGTFRTGAPLGGKWHQAHQHHSSHRRLFVEDECDPVSLSPYYAPQGMTDYGLLDTFQLFVKQCCCTGSAQSQIDNADIQLQVPLMRRHSPSLSCLPSDNQPPIFMHPLYSPSTPYSRSVSHQHTPSSSNMCL